MSGQAELRGLAFGSALHAQRASSERFISLSSISQSTILSSDEIVPQVDGPVAKGRRAPNLW